MPAKTVPEFVAWLKAQNGKASYASSGTGQSPHLSGAWFLQLTGTKAEHIPYRGAAPALQDLMAGVTQFFFDNLTTAIEFVRAGKLRALGLTSAQRNPMTPDLVPICETMPELEAVRRLDLVRRVPAGRHAAEPIVDALNAQMKAWLDDAKTKERFKTMAGFPAYGTPDRVRRLREGPDRAVEERDRQGRPEARRELSFARQPASHDLIDDAAIDSHGGARGPGRGLAAKIDAERRHLVG